MIKTAFIGTLAIFITAGIFGEHPALTLIRALVGLTIFSFFAMLAIQTHNRNVARRDLRRKERRAWRAIHQAAFVQTNTSRKVGQ